MNHNTLSRRRAIARAQDPPRASVSAGARFCVERLEQRTLLAAVPIGSEFRVNTHTPLWQAEAAVTVEADGDLIVAWYSYGQDGDGRGIYARLYDAAGAPKGDEFLVNTYTTGYQTTPAVAVDADGDFVIVWQSENQDGSGLGIFGQRFDAAGVPQDGEFKVNTHTTGDQQQPSVAMDADGDFVVVWEGTGSAGAGIHAQRYDANGAAVGGEFRINASGGSVHFSPAVAMGPGGAFTVAWSAGAQVDVYLRQFDATGAALGPDVRVNTYTTSSQYYPSIAISASGDFVIAWDSNMQDSLSLGVYAQRFDSAGVKQGDEFRVNTSTVEHQHNAAVAMDADGNFVVTWTGAVPGTPSYDIYAQRYNAAGVAQGGEFRINSYTPNVQQYPAVASDPGGDFVVAWESFGQDGSGFGVYAQRFASALQVTSSQFHFATAPHQLRFAFNTDVSASLGIADLILQNLTTGQTVPVGDLSLAYDPATNTATFTYTGGAVGALPDGNYRATLLAEGITSPGGVTMGADHVFEFFFLRGDANHDGRVNLADFNILAGNFGQSPRDFTQGDFNYDGVVNLADFNLLAGRFGQMLSTAPAASSIFGSGRSQDSRVDRFDDLMIEG